MTPHHCTVYCTESEHCDLIYTSRPALVDEVAQAYGLRGLRVTRLEPAAEAAPLAAIPAQYQDPLLGGANPGRHAYLVWWT